MTSYGPPGSPPPPPGAGYGPPPTGGYGPGAGKASFDPKSVNPLDWAIMGLALVAFIFSFIKYYVADISATSGCPAEIKAALSQAADAAGSESAWHGFFGWFGILLAVVGAGLIATSIFAPQTKLAFPPRLGALGALALGTISLLIAIPVTPESDHKEIVSATCTVTGSVGHGVGYWVSLIAVIAALVVAFLRFQQTGGQLPGRGAAGGGTPSAFGQPQGYAQPQGQPGYGQAPQGYNPPQGQSGYGQSPSPQGYQPPSQGYPSPQSASPQSASPQSPSPQPPAQGYPSSQDYQSPQSAPPQQPPSQGYQPPTESRQDEQPGPSQGYQPPPPGYTPPPPRP